MQTAGSSIPRGSASFLENSGSPTRSSPEDLQEKDTEGNPASMSRNLVVLALFLMMVAVGGGGGSLGFGSTTKPSDVGMPALKIPVSDTLGISFASFQSFPVPRESFTRWCKETDADGLSSCEYAYKSQSGRRQRLGGNRSIRYLGTSGRATHGYSTSIGQDHLRQSQS